MKEEEWSVVAFTEREREREIGPIVLAKSHVNATAYKNISDNVFVPA